MNFVKTVDQVEKLLEGWSQRSLTLSGKSKSLSKIVYIVVIPERILNKLESIKKILIGKGKSRKLDIVPLLQIIRTEVKKTLTYLPKLKLYN